MAIFDEVSGYFRSRRMRRFERTFHITTGTRVLDLGGSSAIWQYARVKPRLTLLNLPAALESAADVDRVAGDGRLLPFADGAFDIVFSNSVIEHIGAPEQQARFAREAARVGRSYWIQTPNRRFPFESHMLLPLVHQLPKNWQRRIVHRFTGWEFLERPAPPQRAYYLEHYLTEMRLLDARDLRALFPGADLLVERFCGLPKSLIAVRD